MYFDDDDYFGEMDSICSDFSCGGEEYEEEEDEVMVDVDDISVRVPICGKAEEGSCHLSRSNVLKKFK